MKKFEELSKLSVNETETMIREKWEKENIYESTLKNKEKKFVFYDGPATANGYPGLHHMVAKFLKDTFCKYQTMQGNKVLRKIGWDTHGLPVELQVEKELGFKNKTDIENYGIKDFNVKCKESVLKNKALFQDLTTQMGQFVDLENPYITYDSKYIESEWWILKKFYDEGLFYEGNKVVPYCPRCGTALASHEVAQGYKEVSVDTVTVTFKKKDEDVYFLVWTTTPWTLISNVGLCVNPKEEYIKVLSGGYNFILAKKLADKVLGSEYEILESYLGKDLEYTEYEQLLPFIELSKKAFYVTCDNYVTMEDGTGIVHLAPAFGDDDSKVAARYGLPSINPVGEDGKYTDGPWKGTLVFDADLDVIKYLKKEDKLFKKQKVVHNYPHCWRCSTPLIYYGKPSYYLKVTDFKDKIIENNNKINWYPKFVGEKRFGNWLENLNDWAISRNRYWGTPLPYWTCECGHDHMVGSIDELKEMSIDKIESEVDLHRPFVDDIKLKCSKCGKAMNRCPEVIDCWFDSGSMPFAQYHYPFENEKLFNEQFPADFICEGIDQTRGWFYTLLVISTFVKGVSPFKNVLVNDLLLDSEGKKMSKSKGNIVEPFTTMKEYGADTVRFYLPYVSAVWLPLKFDMNGLKEVYSKFFNPLKNTYSFFSIYANADNIDIDKCFVKYENREEIDKWILSRYNSLVKNVNESFLEYDLNKVVKALADFVSEDLSNWYIRRNRSRFWKSEFDNSKKSVYITTYEILVGLSKLIAPVTPFIAEEIFMKLTDEESVHTSKYPVCDEKLIDVNLENKMSLVRSLITAGRKVREEEKIKVRQPLSKAMLDSKNEEILYGLTELIKEELNVKEIIFSNELNKYMKKEIKPNFKEVGKIFGSKVNEFKKFLENINIDDFDENSKLEFDGVVVTENMYEVKISEKDGYSIGIINNDFIILDKALTSELINEGIAREVVSKIQNMRKEENFVVTDRIEITYNADETLSNAIIAFEEYIKNETLAIKISKDNSLEKNIKLNDLDVALLINK